MYNYSHTVNSSDSSLSRPQVRVAVVGPRGYSGQELVRALLKHPTVRLAVCWTNDSSWNAADEILDVDVSGLVVEPLAGWKARSHEIDLVFLATPNEASMKQAQEFLDAGISVIDLSGAFRLGQAGASRETAKSLYQEFYKFEHTALDWVMKAQYGLMPWRGPQSAPAGDRSKPVLIANPGCYATAMNMALIPLLKAKAITPQNLVIDAKSGTTGAGRKPAESTLLSEAGESCAPYRVGKHQHLPEVIQAVRQYAGAEIDPHLTTHLLPVRRGISCGIYAQPGPALQGLSDGQATSQIGHILRKAYENYPLVKMTELDSSAASALLSLHRVSGTAQTHLVYGVQNQKVYVFSVIDNLMKGAATQAIENLNNWLDLPLETGL